jgi:predicted TPR repeat methyltransferase
VSGSERPERLRGVYGARNSEELAKLYDEWAADYERDVLGYGYTTPAIMAGFLGRHVASGDGRVLDAGVGTGIMGEILVPLGYENLTGIDLSRIMLDLAHEKGVYRELRQMELGESLDLPDDAFHATVAAGVFSAGHAPPGSFDELVRVTEPGGHVIFSVRDDVYTGEGFEEKLEALANDGSWRLVEESRPYRQLPLADPDLKARIFVCRVG